MQVVKTAPGRSWFGSSSSSSCLGDLSFIASFLPTFSRAVLVFRAPGLAELQMVFAEEGIFKTAAGRPSEAGCPQDRRQISAIQEPCPHSW